MRRSWPAASPSTDSTPLAVRFLLVTMLAISQGPSPARAQPCTEDPAGLGAVTVIHGECPLGPGPVPNTRCRLLEVACPDLNPIVVQLRITEPDSGVPARGTVVVGSGGNGSGFYSSQGGAAELFRSLAAMGFRLVDRAWPPPQGWMTAEGGMRLEACRYATLITWIRDHLHTGGAFVATGNSGGSGELSYALTSWGRGEILDLAVPTGGPPFSRMDYHCGLDSTWLSLCPGIVPPDSLDCASACLIPPTHFACNQCAEGPTAEQLRWDSLLHPGADLDYPRTKVHMIFGRRDCGSAVPMGMLYWNAITSEKQVQFVPDTPHFVPSSPEGREAIRRAIDEGTPPALAVGPRPAPRGPRLSLGPNPFDRRVRFRLTLPSSGRVSLHVFDVAGRRVATLLDQDLEAGEYEAAYEPGERVNGVLFYRLLTPSGSRSGTLVRRR